MTNNIANHQKGDLIRIRRGPYTGQRGVIESCDETEINIRLNDEQVMSLSDKDITNLSRAARRAWATMPKHTGRPKGTTPKKMVSVRIDIAIWNQLGEAVTLGWSESREQVVNELIREWLSARSAAIDHSSLSNKE